MSVSVKISLVIGHTGMVYGSASNVHTFTYAKQVEALQDAPGASSGSIANIRG